ncbi:peroxidase family protein [Brevundimonas lenta]|uniref:Ca2+-binding RTX toxin-like protein n=1 Tax=Brevundimonas lenta TaxID=424796 RepID=A0A7W6JEK8_9CAUL|nr:peroxidase family protein [Brevundimonas lenta]MBB4083621.1 Ca2+-binding RTX toxin-like protein [Brevundimonas lenta]
MANFIRSDLAFVLAQIQIAEQHAAVTGSTFNDGTAVTDAELTLGRTSLLSLISGSPNHTFGLRTVSGIFNNLLSNAQTDFGQADNPFPRLTPADYNRQGVDYTPTPNQPGAIVQDTAPRTISNLLVDMTSRNPAATEAYELALEQGLDATATEIEPGVFLYHIPNRAPDEGLSAPFNSWMTLFGQFFDHGLDLVNKGGSGTVFVPLQPDDPLFVPGSPTNFMLLTRANVSGGEAVNATSPFVDQNQTYSSHPSHQVFLRAYSFTGPNGSPEATGKLIQGDNGGMANWADIKAQALQMGIALDDYDVAAIPLVRTDLYGNFIPGANGFPQLLINGTWQSGTPGNPLDATVATKSGHSFLLDIAHGANPFNEQTGQPLPAGQYDAALLNAHFIAGDGRVNENIGLTAVHHVFHSEHNRQVDYSKGIILDSLDDPDFTAAEHLAFLNEWLDVPLSLGAFQALNLANLNPDSFDWNGERLFQAAKFATEMQYQHLVFEDFARKIQPQIDVFVAPVGYDVTVDPSIVAEFAHTVYRFGHSMLTETIDRYDPNFTPDHIGLIQAFLNPVEFDSGGTIDADVAAGAVIRGMTRQVANEIDEFVTDALRNSLLGLPLDLAAINLARGRETGVASLNDARKTFFGMTGDTQLRPYDSWYDLALNLKHEASIINFLAAYGTHTSITSAVSYEAKRDAATAIVMGGAGAPADALDFLNSEGAWANAGTDSITGLDDVDLWIGGLAEKIMPFGGMLGSTFNFVFETQLEALQNGDRFYYLARTAGMNFINELEQNSFASLIMSNTDTEHLPIDVFSTPTYILEVDRLDVDADGSAQFNAGLGNLDPTQAGATPLVDRNPGAGSADPGPLVSYLRYNGGDHVVLGGSALNDTLIASIGDDTIWGDGGNDRIEGGQGNDNIDGGVGNDIITDSGGDDVIKGNTGDDVIHAGPGLNLIIGGVGNDYIITGEDSSEVFGGTGNDFIFGSTFNEGMQGNEGDDWIEIGTQDGAPGDNFDPFGRDTIDGHDVFFGNGGFDEYVAEGGDDIMTGSFGVNRMEGMSGFDWAAYYTLPSVYADLNLPAFDETPIPPTPNTATDRYANVEGLSGSAGNDVLFGSDVADLAAQEVVGGVLQFVEGARGSVLNAAGIARIAGLQDVVGVGVTSFSTGNIILGGSGSDVIEGRAGNDILDGDRYLNCRIGVFDALGVQIATFAGMSGALNAAMIAGTYNPGQLRIVREVLVGGAVGDIDVARFSGLREDYDVVNNGDGSYTVIHARGTAADGTDVLRNFEFMRFSDGLTGTVDFAMGALDTASAHADAFSTGETGTLNGNVFDNNGGGADATIPAGNILAVNALNGSLAAVGVATVLASGATVTLNTNGTFSYNPGNIFRSLPGPLSGAANSTATDSFSYTLFGGNTATVTIIINGQDGNGDVLQGTAGADSLWGGTGNDTLNGLAGLDTANYAQAASGVNVSLNANQASNDGNGGVDTFNSIENVTGSAFNDTLVGNALGNVLSGGLGADTLVGVGGNDSLSGGTGAANTMIGGLGDDHYLVSAADTVIEVAGEGIDTISTTLNAYTQRNNVEHLSFSGTGNFTGTGNTLNNVITGAAGADVLAGLAGNDTLIGGAGIDTVTYASAASAVTANLTGLRATVDGHGGIDVYVSIENLIGSGFADLLVGNTGVNVINGGLERDTILGYAGDDVLHGGSGVSNQLQGGLGDDRYVLTAAGDTIVELAGEGIDSVESLSSYHVMAANVENATYTGVGNFTGVGNAIANVLTGGIGNDMLTGGGGDDTINGGAGQDTAQMAGLLANYTVVAVAGGYQITDSTAGRDGVDTLLGVEQVRFFNGVVALLSNLVAAPAPLVSAKAAAPQVLPADDFVLKSVDLPPVLPALDFDADLSVAASARLALASLRMDHHAHFDGADGPLGSMHHLLGFRDDGRMDDWAF